MVDCSRRSLKIEASRLLCWKDKHFCITLFHFSVWLRSRCDKHMLDWKRGFIYYLSRVFPLSARAHLRSHKIGVYLATRKYISNTMTAKIKHKRARRKCKIEFRSNLSLSFHFSCFFRDSHECQLSKTNSICEGFPALSVWFFLRFTQ